MLNINLNINSGFGGGFGGTCGILGKFFVFLKQKIQNIWLDVNGGYSPNLKNSFAFQGNGTNNFVPLDIALYQGQTTGYIKALVYSGDNTGKQGIFEVIGDADKFIFRQNADKFQLLYNNNASSLWSKVLNPNQWYKVEISQTGSKLSLLLGDNLEEEANTSYWIENCGVLTNVHLLQELGYEFNKSKVAYIDTGIQFLSFQTGKGKYIWDCRNNLKLEIAGVIDDATNHILINEYHRNLFFGFSFIKTLNKVINTDFNDGTIDGWVYVYQDDEIATITNPNGNAMRLEVTTAGTNNIRPAIRKIGTFFDKRKYRIKIKYNLVSGNSILTSVYRGGGYEIVNYNFVGSGEFVFEYYQQLDYASIILNFDGREVGALDIDSVIVEDITTEGVYIPASLTNLGFDTEGNALTNPPVRQGHNGAETEFSFPEDVNLITKDVYMYLFDGGFHANGLNNWLITTYHNGEEPLLYDALLSFDDFAQHQGLFWDLANGSDRGYNFVYDGTQLEFYVRSNAGGEQFHRHTIAFNPNEFYRIGLVWSGLVGDFVHFFVNKQLVYKELATHSYTGQCAYPTNLLCSLNTKYFKGIVKTVQFNNEFFAFSNTTGNIVRDRNNQIDYSIDGTVNDSQWLPRNAKTLKITDIPFNGRNMRMNVIEAGKAYKQIILKDGDLTDAENTAIDKCFITQNTLPINREWVQDANGEYQLDRNGEFIYG